VSAVEKNPLPCSRRENRKVKRLKAEFTSRLFLWRVWKHSMHRKQTPSVFVKTKIGGVRGGSLEPYPIAHKPRSQNPPADHNRRLPLPTL
jgi:hypothetical protein